MLKAIEWYYDIDDENDAREIMNGKSERELFKIMALYSHKLNTIR